MKKLKMKHFVNKQHFVDLFKEYCSENLGWIYNGDNPFALLGKHQRSNPRVYRALMQFSQTIKNFEGDYVDLYEFYQDLK